MAYDKEMKGLGKLPESGFVLLHYEANWADEVDVEGWEVSEVEGLRQHISQAEAHKDWPEYHGVGSNQSIEFESAEDYLMCFEFKPITEAEAETFRKLFNSSSIGEMPDLYFGED